MKILLTGGEGFIGSWTKRELLNRGYEVISLTNQLEALYQKGVAVFYGDIRDSDAVTEAMAHADGFIHLAGVLGTAETINNPRPAAHTNIIGGLNVLEAADQYKVPGVNIAVGNYWMNNTYSITKNTVERFASMFRDERGLQVTTVRALNAYGPGQSVAAPFGCVDPSTPVLKSDLTWVPISSLMPGDELVGIDENVEDKKQRKLCKTIVTGSWATKKEALKITFEDGRTVTCSKDHPWLGSSPSGQLRQWYPASKLKVGHRVVYITDKTWDSGNTYTHGYIAGLLDGEAHIGRSGIYFHQNEGEVLNTYIDEISKMGFKYKMLVKDKRRKSKCYTISIRHMSQKLHLLGEVRSKRLLSRAEKTWVGVAPHGGRKKIIAIEEVGVKDLWDIETTTHTYIANGFASHNSSKVRKIMPSFMCRALSGEPIEIYGDGNQVMDMIYVGDVAKSLVGALNVTMNHGAIKTVIEAGSGNPTTVNDIAEEVAATVERLYGNSVNINHLPMRKGEPENSVVLGKPMTLKLVGMDPTELKSLSDGLDVTARYFKDYLDRRQCI